MKDRATPALGHIPSMIAWVWTLLIASVIVPGLHTYLAGPEAPASGMLAVAALLIATSASLLSLSRRPPWQVGSATMALSLGCALALGPQAAVTVPASLTLLAVGVVSAALFKRMRAAIPEPSQPWSRQRRLGVWTALAFGLLVVLATSRVGIFMEDPGRPDACLIPPMADHSCLTAYAYASELSRQGVDNLYLDELYPEEWGSADGPPEIVPEYAPFALDSYAYPPPFLLLPRVFLPLAPDFTHLRALWYSLSALFFLFALWRVARWLGPPELLALSPLVWGAVPVIAPSLAGNAHPTVMAMAVLGMVALNRGRRPLGGALLSFAILSKISPGLLGIYLLGARRWADAAWTAAFGVIWSGIALALLGPDPFLAFITYELPRLSSGEALGFLAEMGPNLALNTGPFGLPFKAQALGWLQGIEPWAAGKLLSNLWTLIAAGCAIVAGVRSRSPLAQLCAWTGLLTMGALRSPYAPPYVLLTAIWALTLFLARAQSRRMLTLGLLLWLSMNIHLYFIPLKAYIASTLIGQVLAYGLVLWMVLKGPKKREADVAG